MKKAKKIIGIIMILLGGYVLVAHLFVGINRKTAEAKVVSYDEKSSYATVDYEIDGEAYSILGAKMPNAKENDKIVVYYSSSHPDDISFHRFDYVIIIGSVVLLIIGSLLVFIKSKK